MAENNLDEMLSKSICFAADKHKGQVRKGTNIPYIVHPMEAAAIVATMTSDRELIAAAVLHDTIEDCTGVDFDVLKTLFGEKVAFWVKEESENKQKDAVKSWKERKQTTIDYLKKPECSREHKILTLGDKLSNLRAIVRDEATYGDDFWERFNQKDKREHKWYYDSIRKELSILEEYPAMQEYRDLLHKIFPD